MFSPWDWTDVVKFDYNQRGLRNYQIEALKFWLTETGLDGFRFDVAHQVPVDFWNEVRPALQSVKPDVLLLAEAEQRFLHEAAMDITYAWELHHLMNSVAQGKATVKALDEYFARSAAEYNTNDIRMCFTSNHDENSWNGTEWERMGQATEVMTIFTFTIPGMPLIYSGQEAGSSKRLKFFERDPIEWNHHPFFALYQNLNKMKRDNPALWNPGFGGGYQRLGTGRDEQVLAFVRTLDRNKVISILNLSPERTTVELDPEIAGGTYKNHFTGERVKPAKGAIDLDPWGYKIFIR
jgi:glycosidase